jgi:hypothetical protein
MVGHRYRRSRESAGRQENENTNRGDSEHRLVGIISTEAESAITGFR